MTGFTSNNYFLSTEVNNLIDDAQSSVKTKTEVVFSRTLSGQENEDEIKYWRKRLETNGTDFTNSNIHVYYSLTCKSDHQLILLEVIVRLVQVVLVNREICQ